MVWGHHEGQHRPLARSLKLAELRLARPGGLGRGRRPCDAWGTGICWTIGAQDAARKVDLFAVKMESRCAEVSTAPAGPDVSIDKMRVVSALQSPALPRAPRFTSADVRFALSTAWKNMSQSSLAKPPTWKARLSSQEWGISQTQPGLLDWSRPLGWLGSRRERALSDLHESLAGGFQHLAAEIDGPRRDAKESSRHHPGNAVGGESGAGNKEDQQHFLQTSSRASSVIVFSPIPNLSCQYRAETSSFPIDPPPPPSLQ